MKHFFKLSVDTPFVINNKEIIFGDFSKSTTPYNSMSNILFWQKQDDKTFAELFHQYFNIQDIIKYLNIKNCNVSGEMNMSKIFVSKYLQMDITGQERNQIISLDSDKSSQSDYYQPLNKILTDDCQLINKNFYVGSYQNELNNDDLYLVHKEKGFHFRYKILKDFMPQILPLRPIDFLEKKIETVIKPFDINEY